MGAGTLIAFPLHDESVASATRVPPPGQVAASAARPDGGCHPVGGFFDEGRCRNEVEWLAEDAGIEFGRHGIAFTDPVFTGARFSAEKGLTIELALEPRPSPAPGFRFIAVIHDGDDGSQLLVGQWRDTIIVMNGDDYSHRRRMPRVSVEIDPLPDRPLLLTIASGAEGTSLFLDGKRRSRRAGMSLVVPGRNGGARLILGNSVSGRAPWSGCIRGVAIYDKSLEGETIRAHHAAWRADGHFESFASDRPLLLVPFTRKEGRRAVDHSASKNDLFFRRETTLVSRTPFALGFGSEASRVSVAWDVVVNLLGFVPFGLLLAALLGRITTTGRAFTLSVVIGMALSFGIEFLQSWIPTRSSSLVDLVLNTTGTALGALLLLVFTWLAAKGVPAAAAGREDW